MGSTLVSSQIVQQQTDDLSLIQSLSSALNQRTKMSTSMGTGNRRKQKHSNLWMNVDDFSTLSVQSNSGGSSSSSSPSSDMTLPTPPRSPNIAMGFGDMQDIDYDDEDCGSASDQEEIPSAVVDELLELWCEEKDFPVAVNPDDAASFRSTLSELGFDSAFTSNALTGSSSVMSEAEHAENMIDHLLANCKSSYLSPPPTNPSSPKMQAELEFEESYTLSSIKSEVTVNETEEVEEEIVHGNEEIGTDSVPKVERLDDDDIKQEKSTDDLFQHNDLQEFLDNEDELMNYEFDEQMLDKIDDPLNAFQAIEDASSSAAKSVEKLIDVLGSENADQDDDSIANDDYDLFGEPKSKKGRYDIDDDILNFGDLPDIKEDCMWNAFLGNDANLTPSAILGGNNWKQEFTFETIFNEKETLEGTPNATATSVEDKLKAAQKEAEDAAAAAAAAEEEEKNKAMAAFKIAFDNDHRYALSYKAKEASSKSASASGLTKKQLYQGIVVNAEQIDKSGGSSTAKKTKILVPLKDLMETLQKKSFLVSPLGPHKKIIRFTGHDSVKGVLSTASFQSAAIVASQNSRSITTVQSKPNHNVRKRPHPKSPKIEITPALSTDDMDSCSPLSSSIVSSSTGSSSNSSSSNSSSSSTSTKKKTKAHNNMERMRRIDLRNSFDNLKKLVPPLAKIPKCSKVEILRRAEEYIKGLRNQEKRLQKEEQQVRLRNAQLRSRLESTSSSLSNFTSPFTSIGCN